MVNDWTPDIGIHIPILEVAMVYRRPDMEVDEQLHKASDVVSEGGSKYPGMTFEEGVEQALLWVTGRAEEKPMDD